MKHSLVALALLAAAGTAAAQSSVGPFGLLRGPAATATLLAGNSAYPGGLGNAAPFFLAGNTVTGFAAGRNGFSGFTVVLTENTPRLQGFAAMSVDMFNNTYAALLPLYVAADPVLSTLAAPAAPVLTPVGQQIAIGANQLASALRGNFTVSPSLPGLGSLPMP